MLFRPFCGDRLRFFEEPADAMPGGQAPETATADRATAPDTSKDVNTDTAAPETKEPTVAELQTKLAEIERDRARWQTKAQKLAERTKADSKPALATKAVAPKAEPVEYDGSAESLSKIVGNQVQVELEKARFAQMMQADAEKATEAYYEFAQKELGLSEEDAAVHLETMIRLEKSPEELAKDGKTPLSTAERLELGKAQAFYNNWLQIKPQIEKANYDKGYQAAMRKIEKQLPDGKTIPPRGASSGKEETGVMADVAKALNKV